MKLFLILVFLSCVSIGHGKLDSEPESSLTRKLNKRSVQDYRTLSSAEFEQQRYNIEAELRHLNHRRKRRYDNDRQCCGRCDDDDCNCCQRVANQPCPYRTPDKCGIPEQPLPLVRNNTNVRTVTRKYNVSKIVTVTDSPIDYQLIEQRLIQNLEQEIRELRQHEEKKQIDYENKLRLEFEQLLPGSEAVDDSILTRLELEIQNLRQHWPVSNPQQRRVILENHISEQRRQNDLNLNLWEERRRNEFQTLLNDLRFKQGNPLRNIPVNFEVVEKETIYEHERVYETIRQECCNRCAPRDCTPVQQPCPECPVQRPCPDCPVQRPCPDCPVQQPCNNCPVARPACPAVDNCRCNHAFVSCKY